MTTKADVIRVHRAHPSWNATQIANVLGCDSAYVRATKQRYNLEIPSGFERDANSVGALGQAARDAGLTVADIKKIAEARRVHALAARAEAE